MSRNMRMAVVGGGETGASIIRDLGKYPFIDIAMVADADENAPGMNLARERGIPVTGDFMDIIGLGKGVDIIVDAVGRKEVRIALRYHLHESRNDHTVIMPEIVTILMGAMSNNLPEIPKSRHGFQVY